MSPLRRASEPQRRGESPDVTARRYVSEGRLTVTHLDGGYIGAVCQGHRHLHHLGHDPDRGWWCSCDRGIECVHLLALQLVTSEQRLEPRLPPRPPRQRR